MIGTLLLVGVLVGCGGGIAVTEPMTPQQARAQVIDAGKELVRDLGLRGNLVETVFSYESCTDDNKGPFRGKLVMNLLDARRNPVRAGGPRDAHCRTATARMAGRPRLPLTQQRNVDEE
ncbi:hypothetical protein A5654_19180 [Mycolicibacterium fortuitum]|nr:hypothetical protein A5654_19180 [Mycolicibacterium fortuitum]